RPVSLEIPGTKGMRDPRPEPNRVREPERAVVREAELLERRQVSMRVDAEVVVALAGDRACEPFELLLLGRERPGILRGGVAAVQAHLRACGLQRLHEARAEALVGLRSGPVGRMSVAGHDEERRAGLVRA